MAKIIKKESGLKKEILYHKKQIFKKSLFVIVFLICFGAGLWLSSYSKERYLLLLPAGFFILTVFNIVSIKKSGEKIDILKSGVKGENFAINHFKALPDSYTVFSNLKIFYKGHCSELDTLIVGPTGVFIIETKNLNGHIYGDANSEYWIKRKISRGGNIYSKNFYSPIKQVNTHIFRTAGYLRQNKINTYITPIVYFANADTEIEIKNMDKKTLVFSQGQDGANKVLRYILNNNQSLTVKETTKIVKLLSQNT